MRRNAPDRGKSSLAWPPTREDLARLYVTEHLSAMKISKLYGLKYSNPKSGEAMVLHYMKKWRITRRDPAEHLRKITEETVDKWVKRYQAGESLRDVASDDVDPVTVFNHLRKRGTHLRDKVEAQIKAVSIHPKSPFDGTLLDRAYMQGYARGDLWITRHGRAFRARTGTTHPAMLELSTGLFSTYGPVYEYPRNAKVTGFEWGIDTDLDESFQFLLESGVDLFRDNSRFTSFLAGFFDAEGSIVYHKKKWGGGFETYIPNVDVSLLEKIAAKLKEMGFSPKLHKMYYNPAKKRVQGRGWIWRIDLVGYQDVNRFLKLVPFRHRERIAKARIALRLPFRASEEERESVRSEWSTMLQAIEDEVRGSIRVASELVTNFKQSSPKYRDKL